jgi:hypothetical protein
MAAAPFIPPDLLALIPEPYRAASRVGDSAEEIARWRAERRRHFPTDENVSRKRARAEACEETGQLPGAAAPMGAMRRRAPAAAEGAPPEKPDSGPEEEPA